MGKRRWIVLVVAVVPLVFGGRWLWAEVVSPWLEPFPGKYDSAAKSTDLKSDLALMWQTKRLRGTPDASLGPNPRGSTDSAINAASRVFNTADLKGKTREEAVFLLGDPKSNSDSVYNFPFQAAPPASIVYRFDSGEYGWQFNLVLSYDGKIKDVERHWIH